jgi:hypothetical protein
VRRPAGRLRQKKKGRRDAGLFLTGLFFSRFLASVAVAAPVVAFRNLRVRLFGWLRAIRAVWLVALGRAACVASIGHGIFLDFSGVRAPHAAG